MSKSFNAALAAICTIAAAAETPTPFVDWFSTNFTPIVEHAYNQEAFTFSPAQSAAPETVTRITANAQLSAFGANEALPDLTGNARAALLIAERKADKRLAYFGWTASGWVELAGSEPNEDAEVDLHAEIDDSVEPAEVSYSANGILLHSAADSSRTIFTTMNAANAPSIIALTGDASMSYASGSYEDPSRSAAVVQQNGSFAYYPNVRAAIDASTESGGKPMVLRRTQVDESIVGLENPILLNDPLFNSARPTLMFNDGIKGELLVSMENAPASIDMCIAAPASAIANLHIHGEDGVAYILTPDSAGVHLKSTSIPKDSGEFTGWFSIPDNGRIFLSGLADSMLGSNKTLFVQGNGSLTLCNTNSATGGITVESGELVFCSTNSAISVYLEGPASAVVTDPSSASAISADEGATMEFDLRKRPVTNNMVLLDNVADSLVMPFLTVSGNRIAYAKEGPSGGIIAKVADAPELAAESPFSIEPGLGNNIVNTRIGNAVEGFRYSLLAADLLTGPFLPIGEEKTALDDGVLELSIEDEMKAQRFYKLSVEY